MKNRRKARVLALQVLYAFDLRPDDSIVLLFDIIAKNSNSSEETISYARILVNKTYAQMSESDSFLQKHAANWDIKRMAVIDRNVIRMATTELRLEQNVPYKVVMDEAVEIAKLYGTDESGKFVNGIIDAIYKELFNIQ